MIALLPGSGFRRVFLHGVFLTSTEMRRISALHLYCPAVAKPFCADSLITFTLWPSACPSSSSVSLPLSLFCIFSLSYLPDPWTSLIQPQSPSLGMEQCWAELCGQSLEAKGLLTWRLAPLFSERQRPQWESLGVRQTGFSLRIFTFYPWNLCQLI